MPHVVTENCADCRFTDCVATCPVACFHGDGDRLYIDPEVCIDCGACIPVCPVHAIYDALDIPGDQVLWIAIHADVARTRPVLDSRQPPKPTAESRKAQLGF